MSLKKLSNNLSNQDIIPVLPNRYSYFLQKKKNYSQWFMHTPILISHQPIEISAFKEAIHYILQRHSSLRINAHFLEKALLQTIKPFETISNICICYSYKKSCKVSFKSYLEGKIKENEKLIALPDNLIKFLVFENTEEKTTVLVSLFHHILADAYSFKIIIDELINIYNKILTKEEIILNKNSTPYKEFCEYSIKLFKQSMEEESTYWKKMPWSGVRRLPLDYNADISSNTEGSSVSSVSSINIASIKSFMEYFKGEGSYGLIKALLIAIAKAYKYHFNMDMLLINYVYNGRFSSDESIRLDRTVGWFSEGTPIFLSPQDSLQKLINSLESQIDRLYCDNSSYGYLKYIFQALPEDPFCFPEISFNYTPPSLGTSSYKGFFTPTTEFSAHFSPPADTQRVYLLNAKAYFTQENFILSWNYSNTLFKKSKIDLFNHRCLEELKNIIYELNT
jgi:hypothetical protein